jgi:hypothetical protein
VVSTKAVLVEDCTWLHHRSRCGKGTWLRPGTPSSLALLSASRACGPGWRSLYIKTGNHMGNLGARTDLILTLIA